MSVSPFANRLAKATTCSPFEYSHTRGPVALTSMTRLLFSSAIRRSPFGRSSALFGLFSAPGPPVGPKALTRACARLTSMTRLLAWSVMRRSPGWLNPGWRAGGMPRLMLASAERSDGFVVLGEVALPADTKLRVPVRPPGQVKKLGPFHEPPVAAARSQLAFKMWSTSAWGIGPPGPPPVRPDGHALEDGSVRPL